mgnify:CR=1 FL=1
MAGDGAAAVQFVRDGEYDVIFMDCQMPTMDGFEATRHIRLLDSATGSRTPIVAMTANATEEDRNQCIAAGMDGFLPKPITEIELISVIRKIGLKDRTFA